MNRAASEPIPLVTHCPARATSFVWRAPSGGGALTVVCKITYEICPDVSPLAEDQEEIHEEDVHWGNVEHHSLTAPSDLVPYKPRADILVTGHVHAPRGQSVRALFARVIVGEVNKTIGVYGDRRILHGGDLSPPAQIDRIPLCWERAAGGPGTENPVGVQPYFPGVAGGPSWAPNFQPHGAYIASALAPIQPICFAPLSPHWPQRSSRLGRVAATWDHHAWRGRPLPEGLDAAYFNSAPTDQQTAYLAPAERIVLENLHPEHPRIVTTLDGLVPRAALRRHGRPSEAVDLRADTLWIDVDRGVCCVTWRGTVALEAALGAEIHITADGVAASPPVAATTVWADSNAAETTLALFAGGTVPTGSPLPFAAPVPGAALPLVLPPPSPSISNQKQEVFDPDGTMTLAAPFALPVTDLPAGWAPSGPGVPPPPAEVRVPVPAPLPSPPALPPSFVAPPVQPSPVASYSTEVGDPSPAPVIEREAVTERPEPWPVRGAPLSPPAVSPAQEPAAQPSEASPAIDVESYPVERWAAILAEIDKALCPRSDVLRAHDLTEVDWAAVDRRWKEALAREAAAGGHVQRLEHDSAYVGALERLRGRPLVALEYAQILVAAERRRVVQALEAMEMPASAHLPLTRLWTMKVARDPQLSIEMLRAVAALRDAPGALSTDEPGAGRGA